MITFDRTPDDGLLQFELVTGGDLGVERISRRDGSWTTADIEDFGSLPGGRTAMWRGDDDPVSNDTFYDTAVFDTDPTDIETVRIRINAATAGACVPCTIAVDRDAAYTCDPANDPSSNNPSTTASPIQPSQQAMLDDTVTDGTNDEDFYAVTIPDGETRQYTLRSVVGNARFTLVNAQDLALPGTTRSNEPMPFVNVITNNSGAELDAWVGIKSLFGAPPLHAVLARGEHPAGSLIG